MSYHDAWQAYRDWLDSTDAVYLKHEGIVEGDIWYCPKCERDTFIYEEPIEGSTKIIRGCQRCDHQQICNPDDNILDSSQL